MHDCPAPGCKRSVPLEYLACRTHWFKIPKALRDAVWRTWNDGKGAGSVAHTEAMAAAIRSLERQG